MLPARVLKPVTVMSSQKIRLLCLHGYTQNASTFSQRIGSFRKGLKSRCEFVFVDAPFESTGLPGDEVNEAQGAETEGRSWWQWHDTGPAARPSLAASYTGWDRAQEVLIEAIKEHKPHGVLGFSQGATAAALLLACFQNEDVRKQLGDVEPPGFGILIAGFIPRDPSYISILKTLGGYVTSPTLFVHGSADRLVPWERTQSLIECFSSSNVDVYSHEGAHLVPTCSGPFKQTLTEFLDKVKDRQTA